MCPDINLPIWNAITASNLDAWWCVFYKYWWFSLFLIVPSVMVVRWLFQKLASASSEMMHLTRQGVVVMIGCLAILTFVLISGVVTAWWPQWLLWSAGIDPATSPYVLSPWGVQFLVNNLQRIAWSILLAWFVLILLDIALAYLNRDKLASDMNHLKERLNHFRETMHEPFRKPMPIEAHDNESSSKGTASQAMEVTTPHRSESKIGSPGLVDQTVRPSGSSPSTAADGTKNDAMVEAATASITHQTKTEAPKRSDKPLIWPGTEWIVRSLNDSEPMYVLDRASPGQPLQQDVAFESNAEWFLLEEAGRFLWVEAKPRDDDDSFDVPRVEMKLRGAAFLIHGSQEFEGDSRTIKVDAGTTNLVQINPGCVYRLKFDKEGRRVELDLRTGDKEQP